MTSAIDKIEEMVRRIVAKFDLEKIILFGSHARGEAGSDIDADLLVVMRYSWSRRKKAAEIHLSFWEIALPADVLVYQPEQVEKYKNIVGTIIYPDLREGKVVYDRAA